MEKQAELPKIWCVGVAVCAASYTFDRLFSYIAMQEIPAGCRVVVPFGKGNAKRVGIVLSCAEQAAQPEQQLKPVLAVVDKQPILSPEMLDLVFWLKEMTFCTYYDAVRTILPAGMQVQLVETISLAEPQPDCGEQRPSRNSGGFWRTQTHRAKKSWIRWCRKAFCSGRKR